MRNRVKFRELENLVGGSDIWRTNYWPNAIRIYRDRYNPRELYAVASRPDKVKIFRSHYTSKWIKTVSLTKDLLFALSLTFEPLKHDYGDTSSNRRVKVAKFLMEWGKK